MGTAREEKVELAEARSHVYGLLAAIFRAVPDAALVKTVRDGHLERTLIELGITTKEELLPKRADAQLIEDLAVEYTRLFVGPGPRISLYESVYDCSGNRSEAALWSEQTVQVKKFIEATGLSYAEDFNELPDHVSAELELMGRFAAYEATAWRDENGREAAIIARAQARFFHEHLGAWVPKLCDAIIERTEMPFYRAIAELTKIVIEFEHDCLDCEESNKGEMAADDSSDGGGCFTGSVCS